MTAAELRQFVPTLFSTVAVEGACYGNVTQDESIRLTDTLMGCLGSINAATSSKLHGAAALEAEAQVKAGSIKPITCDGLVRTTIFLPVPGVELVRLVEPQNKDDDNSAVQVAFYLGRYTQELMARTKLLARLVSQPCFSQLRTKEQLGYMVWSGLSLLENEVCLRFRVQSATSGPLYLRQRIMAFLVRHAHDAAAAPASRVITPTTTTTTTTTCVLCHVFG